MAKCPVCNKEFKTKQALRDHVHSAHPAKAGSYYPKVKAAPMRMNPPAKVQPGFKSGVDGRMAMEEYYGTCKKGLTTLLVCPGKSGVSRLDSYAVLYDQYKIVQWQVRFTTRVGTMVSGMYIAGAAYSNADKPATIGDVAVLEPKVHHPIWKESTLNVPASRLMKQKYMYVYDKLIGKEDTIAGKIFVWVDGDAAEIDAWIRYEVLFSGPSNNSKSEDIIKTDGKTWKYGEKVITQFPPGLDEGYTVDVEATSDISTYFDKIFDTYKVVDEAIQGTVRYYHVLSQALATATLPALGSAAIFHMARRPFPRGLPAGGSGLLEACKEAPGQNTEVEIPDFATGGESSRRTASSCEFEDIDLGHEDGVEEQ